MAGAAVVAAVAAGSGTGKRQWDRHRDGDRHGYRDRNGLHGDVLPSDSPGQLCCGRPQVGGCDQLHVDDARYPGERLLRQPAKRAVSHGRAVGPAGSVRSPSRAPQTGARMLLLSGGAFAYPFVNVGGCIMATDSSAAGQACGTAYQAAIECELAACPATVCPVAVNQTTGQADAAEVAALIGTFDATTGLIKSNGCIEWADTTVCASYVSAETTACASSGNAVTTCDNLVDGASTPSGIEAEFAPYCGG